jgi:ribosomal protein L29
MKEMENLRKKSDSELNRIKRDLQMENVKSIANLRGLGYDRKSAFRLGENKRTIARINTILMERILRRVYGK